MTVLAQPTRVLYFGSREWIDVPARWTIREVHTHVRRHGAVPLKGPRYIAIGRQMQADIAEHGQLVVIEGEADGADILSRIIAGNLGQNVERFPVDHALDGPWPAAGPRRNARMDREGRPVLARGFVVGRRGTPLSRGSAGMLGILQRRGCPVIVHRDDGVEVPS